MMVMASFTGSPEPILAPTPEESRTYIARAEEGLSRLSRILERMGEASPAVVFVTAAFGMQAAGVVVRRLAQGR